MLATLFAQYPTVIIILAFAVAGALTMALMPAWIKVLSRRHIGQQVRDDGPQTHLVKQGTPTMGGVMMLIAAALAVILIGYPSPELVLLLVMTLLTGALGLVDDSEKVVKQRSLGLTPKAKLAVQFLLAIVFCLVAVNCFKIAPTVEIPFVYTFDLGIPTTVIPVAGGISIPWLYLFYVTLLIAGLSNATNLTDGLDGLAAGTVMVSMIVMAMIAYQLDLLDNAIFAAAIAGVCLGFLWFNAYPASIFMGDTGSLALGTALACLAVFTKTEFIVLIIGGLFIAEALSVMIQVIHYKRTGKRIFLMAPLHHHFEKKGWGEVKVVIRFWIVSGVLAAIGFFWFFLASLV